MFIRQHQLQHIDFKLQEEHEKPSGKTRFQAAIS